MKDNQKNNEIAATIEPPVQILVRLSRDEIDACKAETGATADATAVACFVRKNLRKGAR